MKDPWDEDATWAERFFIWLLRWGGTIFIGLLLIYMLLVAYFWFRPLR